MMSIPEPVGGQFNILTNAEVRRIHGAAMEVLRRLGVKVWSENGRRLLAGAGADVDDKTMIVRMEESLVMDTVRKAPSHFSFYGRDPGYKLVMGKKRVHFALCGQGVKVQDLEGNIRLATLRDVEDLALLTDYCENIHHVSMMTTPMDVPAESMHVQALWGMLKNTGKTVDGYTYGERAAEESIQLGAIVRGGVEELSKKPMLLGFTNPVSPMQLSKELVDGAIVYAKFRQPVLYAPEALSGGTAPATLAGLVVQQTAEVLAGIMVSQLANPGTPVFFGTVSAAMDMRTGMPALGGPEVGLINLATAQLARYYKLPCRGTGGNSDSKALDAQAGIETALGILQASYAGVNFMYDAAGSMDGSLTTSYEKIVVDNEICGMVSRILRGIEITDETLAVDEIVRMGPAASYLGTPFTLDHFRKEHYIPQLLDRRSRDQWEAAGAEDIAPVAREKAKWILKNHSPKPLDNDVISEGEEFVKKTVMSYRR